MRTRSVAPSPSSEYSLLDKVFARMGIGISVTGQVGWHLANNAYLVERIFSSNARPPQVWLKTRNGAPRLDMYQGFRSDLTGRPGITSRRRPFGSFTTRPITSTQSMPSENWAGFWTVDRSITVSGLKMVISASAPG